MLVFFVVHIILHLFGGCGILQEHYVAIVWPVVMRACAVRFCYEA